ncbi:MAG: DUF4440 domain-containing protein [Thermoleophilia bacterium]
MDAERAAAELGAREPLFHHPGLGTTRADYEAQTTVDFREVGASGREYDREAVWAVLAERADRAEGGGEVRDLRVRHLGGDAWLATYTLHLPSRVSRRATIWERADDGWRAVYHQGTPAG